ncbi:MAG TPA: DUF4276 family protein [Arcobacter sp.]|nr:DUF4276 family protein [Arcobacter sp.]
MVRVGISVEGATEERFIKICLVPHFVQKNIFITPVSMGGNVSIDRVRHEMNKLIYSFDVVSTFYDFYGFKRKQKDETKSSLERQILESVPKAVQGKIIPYIQMYEFEGLLFSSPSTIATVLEQEKIKHWAEDILRKFHGNPEFINNSSQTAPSKRLAITPYRKTTHGPNIAKQIGLDVLREKCKGFDDWVNRLEALAE